MVQITFSSLPRRLMTVTNPGTRQRLRPTKPVDVNKIRDKYEAERLKRTTDLGAFQYQPVPFEGRLAHFDKDPYATGTRDQPTTEREMDVLIIGGGFMGLTLGVELTDRGMTDFVMIDIAADFGGTWYWNRYPGLRCDIESYIYFPLLERTGYMPRERYSTGAEILEYAQSLGRDFGLYERAFFETRVTAMVWHADERRWHVTTDRGDLFKARYVASQSGLFTRPHLPGTPGVDTFEGHSFHTSRWDYDYTGGSSSEPLTKLSDKRVAVIGTGITALGVVPRVAASAQQLTVFQRTASQVHPRENGPTDPDWFAALPKGWQRKRMASFDTFAFDRLPVDCHVEDGWTDFVHYQNDAVAELGPAPSPEDVGDALERSDYEWNEMVRDRIESVVTDPVTAEKLKAWYRTGCKRPGFSDEYLPAFNLPHVSVVDVSVDSIERVTPRGIVSGGKEHEFDCIIYATGFESGKSWTDKAGYDVVGRDGALLSEKFANGMRTHWGVLSNGFPNLFFLGLTQTGGVGNFVRLVVEQVDHVAGILELARQQGVVTVEPSKKVEDEFNDVLDAQVDARGPFLNACTPGNYNNEGKTRNRLNSLASGIYLPGTEFFQWVEDWLQDGTFAGYEVTH
jgi:cyclohexanone monooxygenase